MRRGSIIGVIVLCLLVLFTVGASGALANPQQFSPGYYANHSWPWGPEDPGYTFGGVQYPAAAGAATMLTPARGDKTYTAFNTLVAAVLNAQPSFFGDKNILDAWLVAHPLGSGVAASSAAWQEIEPVVYRLQATFL